MLKIEQKELESLVERQVIGQNDRGVFARKLQPVLARGGWVEVDATGGEGDRPVGIQRPLISSTGSANLRTESGHRG